jgi:hypothetical protein
MQVHDQGYGVRSLCDHARVSYAQWAGGVCTRACHREDEAIAAWCREHNRKRAGSLARDRLLEWCAGQSPACSRLYANASATISLCNNATPGRTFLPGSMCTLSQDDSDRGGSVLSLLFSNVKGAFMIDAGPLYSPCAGCRKAGWRGCERGDVISFPGAMTVHIECMRLLCQARPAIIQMTTA